jgi:uncharacterized membrane protein
MHWHHGGLVFGWLLGAVFLVLLVGLAVYLAAGLTRARLAPQHSAGAGGHAQPDDPLAILRLRYARGELSRDEFLRANEDLGGAPIGPDGG